MKILALRGCNLASLAGPFVVDFEAAPLAHAGLFAITGPTGAGKSTLLDALALALYDRLPRLAHASRTEIGRADAADDRIPGNDVRTILRNGAGEGFAEVDFVGRDGGRYRARWEVRRARGRANGTLQKQELSLIAIGTGAQLGGGKLDTLAVIRDKVGLDYDQFRRSVLLAQNEFDAFLRAKSEERAGLLELMTGTAIYGQLSKAAHERCQQEKDALKLLDAELVRVNVLADDERAAMETGFAGAEAAAARLKAEGEALLAEMAWYGKAADLTAKIADAQTQVDASGQAITEAEPERTRLADMRRALSAAPIVAEVDRAAGTVASLGREEEGARQALVERKAERESQQAARRTAKLAEDKAESDFKAAGPLLDQAAELDARMVERQTRLELCRTGMAEAASLSASAEEVLKRASGERVACAEKIGKIEAWLATHQDRKPLVEQLDRWLDGIGVHAKSQAERDGAAKAASGFTATMAQLGEEERTSRERPAEIDIALVELDKAIAELTATVASEDLEALEQARLRLGDRRRWLEAAFTEGRTAIALAAREEQLAERRRKAAAQRDAADKEVAEIDTRRTTIDSLLPEARRALDLAIAAEGKEAALLRERLIEGEPCPVCGSPDHPLGNVRTVLSELLVSQRQRVGELDSERAALSRQREGASGVLASAGATLRQAAEDSASIATEKAMLLARWNEARPGTGILLPDDPFALLDLPALKAARAACEAEQTKVAANSQRIRLAATDLRNQSDQRDHLRRERQALTDRLTELGLALGEAKAGLDRALSDRDRAAGEMARWDSLLSAPLAVVADWRPKLEGDAAALVILCRHLAQEWQRGCDSLDVQKDAERKLLSTCEHAQTALANALQGADKAAAALAEEGAAFEHLRRDRSTLFEGRKTGEVRTEFNDIRKACKGAHQQAQEAWAAADTAYGVAEERVRVLGESLGAAKAGWADAVAARDRRLSEIGLDVAAVQAAIALGKAWAVAEEARHSALRDAGMTAAAILAERQGALVTHAASNRPIRAEGALATLMPEQAAAREDADSKLSELRTRLAEDDRNRDSARLTRARIGKQRLVHDLWKGMADLIGSADGKKFRVFAQGLTLDRLLGLANAHLADLTPRYVLQRAPGGDLDLQVVDGDMADEVRGVASLSGGERFLVSLSLALGLASMTGSRIIAESLFIDEGFGALDSESLDIAISALETLHASGRKVGVISHVQPMIDRIGVQIRVTKLGGGRSVVETQVA